MRMTRKAFIKNMALAAGVAALGRNMAWLLKNLKSGDAIPRSADESWLPMHFIH